MVSMVGLTAEGKLHMDGRPKLRTRRFCDRGFRLPFLKEHLVRKEPRDKARRKAQPTNRVEPSL